MTARPTLPVTVIGGYLGAGKTTLINQLLRHADGMRLAVLVNDFGELPIDADLIESRDDNVISITGGCVCCSYGSDLMEALIDLDQMDPAPDHLLIETSGVGLPDAIAESVQLIPRYTIDGIVVLADAETLRNRGEDRYLHDTITRQLAAADIVMLNKVDLLAPEASAETRRWLEEKIAEIPIVETVNADVPLAVVLGVGHLFDEKRTKTPGHHHANHEADVFEIDRPVNPEALMDRLSAHALGLIRVKGFIRSSDGRFCGVQSVGRRWAVSETSPTGEEKGRIVCITHMPPIDSQAISRIINELD